MINFIQFLKIRYDASKVVMIKDFPTWAVVATVNEPPALVQAFVAWHLSQGAAAIFLYCDDPDDPLPRLLSHLPRVTVIACDDLHWQRVNKGRPHRHEVRQVCNARDAYAKAGTDWVLHIDADEFVWSDKGVGQALATVSNDADALIAPVAERVYEGAAQGASIFEGAFRRTFRGNEAEGLRIFGADYTLTNRGLTGHAQGKAFVRTGRPLKLSIHRPRKNRGDDEPQFARVDAGTLELLHFEGLTPAHWTFKLTRMARAFEMNDGMPLSSHRRKQADLLICDPDGAGALHDRLKCPDDTLQGRLKRRDLWATPVCDIRLAVGAFFPDQLIDLTPQAIDAWLRREKSEVMSFLRRDPS